MPDNPRLYLVRHGETDANLITPFSGWSDHRLNERGRGQAEALARRLEGEGIERLFSSPVRRCVETAEILARGLGASVRTVHALHEIELGPWKGLTANEVQERWPDQYRAWRENPESFRLDGREPLQRVLERALDGTDQVARSMLDAPDFPALLITHLAVIRVLWLFAQGRTLADYHQVNGPHCEPFPVRWLRRRTLEVVSSAPSADPADPADPLSEKGPG